MGALSTVGTILFYTSLAIAFVAAIMLWSELKVRWKKRK